MPGVETPLSLIRSRAALVAAAASLASVLACHRASSPPKNFRIIPVPGFCGQRSAVALYRGKAPRRAAEPTGALVVRLTAADTGLTPPQGPVRLLPAAGAAGQPRTLTAAEGTLRTGPLAAGRYVLEATGTGYQARRLTVSVRPGVTDTVRFRLAAACVRRETD